MHTKYLVDFLGNEPQVYRLQSGRSNHYTIAPVCKCNDFKKCYSQFPCLALSTYGIVWRTSRQACLLYPWARHLTGCLRFYVADRWWGQAVHPSWWPSLTKDMQTEHELTRVNEKRFIFDWLDLSK